MRNKEVWFVVLTSWISAACKDQADHGKEYLEEKKNDFHLRKTKQVILQISYSCVVW